MAEHVYCLACLRSHPALVAIAVNDRCPSQPDLMAALEKSLTKGATSPNKQVESKD